MSCVEMNIKGGCKVRAKFIQRTILAGVGLCALVSGTEIKADENVATVYVSAKGSDNNPGTLNQPVQTLYAAQQLARKMPRSKPVVVQVSQGSYYLDKALQLSPEDSGTKEAPMKWQTENGKAVRILGGKPLSLNWQKFNAKIWQAKVTDCEKIDQLFVNEKRQILARYPNYNPDELYFCGAGATWTRMKQWKNPETAYIHALHAAKWGGGHIKLERDKNGQLYERMISIDTTTQGNAARLNDTLRFAENVFEELDSPGEWFYDQKSSILYYQPAAGVDLRSAKVEAVYNPHLITVEGTRVKPVKFIEFDGFTVTGASPTWEKTTDHLPNGGDFVVHRGGAVTLRGTEDCKISNCKFAELGGNAVFIDAYNRRTVVQGNVIRNVGANAIAVCGASETMRGDQFFKVLDETFKAGRLVRNKWATPKGWYGLPTDLTPGPKTENYPSECLISDNLITVVGELEKQTSGVLMSMTMNNTVSHNTMFKLPRAGICLNDGAWGGHVIEYNDVYDTVRETADHGPFNSWGKDRYWTWADHNGDHSKNPDAKKYALIDAITPTIIRHNRFAHPLHSTHSWGIDLDDGSTNYKIYNNLTLGCAVKLREGFNRTVENNVFISSGENTPGKHVCFSKNEDIYRRNVVVNFNSDCVWRGIHHYPKQMKEIDYNCYFTPHRYPKWLTNGRGKRRGQDLKSWQKEGMEVHSVIADPMFVDAANGDYRVKSGSPALKLGFKNFRMDQFGVKSDGLKKLLPSRDLAVYARETAKGNLHKSKRSDKKVSFLGSLLKNMTTESEKSAVGIGEITGVLIMDAPESSPLYKAGLRVGDLIITFNGKKVHTLQQLMNFCEKYSGKVVVIQVHDDARVRKYKLRLPKKITVRSIKASSNWNAEYGADKAIDGDFETRWGAKNGSRSGSLELNLGTVQTVTGVTLDEGIFNRIKAFRIMTKEGDSWRTVYSGTGIGGKMTLAFKEPVKTQFLKVVVDKAVDVPTLHEITLY